MLQLFSVLPLPLESEAQRRKDHHGLFRPFLLKHESSQADGDKNTTGMGDDPEILEVLQTKEGSPFGY